MPTPPMLRTPAPAGARPAPDPLVALNVLLLAVVASGLLIAGILAVYDWKTPGAETPLVFWLAVVAGFLVAVDLLALGVRYARRARLGL